MISIGEGLDLIYEHCGISANIVSSISSPAGGPSGITWDGANYVTCDDTTEKIYIHSGTTSTIDSSYGTPGYPTGMVYAPPNLFHCEDDTDKIYQHDGTDPTITFSFTCGGYKNPSAMAWDGTNLIVAGQNLDSGDSIIIHSGTSQTVTSSFGVAIKTGLVVINGNLISAERSGSKIFVHSGITATVTDSFTTDHGVEGLSYRPVIYAPTAGTLITADNTGGSGQIYYHVGVSATIASSFSFNTVTGLTIAEGNLIAIGEITDKVYIFSGTNSVVKNSWSHPSSGVGFRAEGLTFDGSDLIIGEESGSSYNLIYIHSGTTSTVTSTFADPDVRGLAYDSTNTNLISVRQSAPAKVLIHSGVTATIIDSFNTIGTSLALTMRGDNLIVGNQQHQKIELHAGITYHIYEQFSSPDALLNGMTFLAS